MAALLLAYDGWTALGEGIGIHWLFQWNAGYQLSSPYLRSKHASERSFRT
jgi:hypothetical protein